MSKECTICKTLIISSCEKYNIKIECTKYSNIPIVWFIENIIGNTFITNCSDMCFSCYNLINELDKLQKTYEAVRLKLTNYLGCITTLRKANVLCQTDTFLQNILEFDIHAKYKKRNDHLTDIENLVCSSNGNLQNCRAKEHTKQYECHICFKKFASKNGFSLHLKKKHATESIAKEIVGSVLNECKIKEHVKIEVTSSEVTEDQHMFLKKEAPDLLAASHKVINDFIDVKHDMHGDEIISNLIKNEENVVTENIFSGMIDVKPDIESIVCDKPLSIGNSHVKTKKSTKKKRPDILKPHKCSTCDKTFKTQSELKSHMSAHNDVRPFICEICGQGYKNKTALDIHVGMHNGINPFTCIYCNKSFTQKGALRRHMPIHTGEAPYQCDLCGKRFVHHTSFHIHQLSHTGQKRYKCNICGLALLSGSHLKRHMRVHTGERNYACSTCGKRFAERYNLASHQKLHENPGSGKGARRSHRCQVCGTSYEKRIKLKEHLTKEHQCLTIDTAIPINHQLLINETKTEEIPVLSSNFKTEITQQY